ncbi:MAG TPA: energy transducer TonB [Candidatus Sulfotelmatobacter sp.]|nr:energy transducer TonB [Candidatus Sulfotelmatobacter sp.]
MTAASPGHHLFSVLTNEHDALFRTRKDMFLLSLLGQAAILALIIYFTSCVIRNPPEIARRMPDLGKFPLIFSGLNGGGGGNHNPLPASNGDPPRASLQMQIVSPSVMVPTEMPKLPSEATVMVAPDVRFPVASHIGDPSSPFSKWLSDGPGGPRGIGDGCCDGIGPDSGPYVGEGTPGAHPGRNGVTMPEAIYSPEPSFSDEARKAKFQGIVMLMVVVGKDGRVYDIRVRQSLGMGLDEQAIEAVKSWRFRPAMFQGQPVATQIAVQVDFHLY